MWKWLNVFKKSKTQKSETELEFEEKLNEIKVIRDKVLAIKTIQPYASLSIGDISIKVLIPNIDKYSRYVELTVVNRKYLSRDLKYRHLVSISAFFRSQDDGIFTRPIVELHRLAEAYYNLGRLNLEFDYGINTVHDLYFARMTEPIIKDLEGILTTILEYA